VPPTPMTFADTDGHSTPTHRDNRGAGIDRRVHRVEKVADTSRLGDRQDNGGTGSDCVRPLDIQGRFQRPTTIGTSGFADDFQSCRRQAELIRKALQITLDARTAVGIHDTDDLRCPIHFQLINLVGVANLRWAVTRKARAKVDVERRPTVAGSERASDLHTLPSNAGIGRQQDA